MGHLQPTHQRLPPLQSAAASRLVAAVLLLIAMGTGKAQNSQRSRAQPGTIRIQRVAVLSGGGNGAHLRLTSWVTRDSRGRYYAAGLTDPARIGIYDPRGRFLQTMGRGGGGPGEFTHVQRVFVSPGDSLFAFDRSQQISVFSPEHRFVRSFRPPGQVRDIRFVGSRLILSIGFPEQVPALVATDRQGRRLGTLGSASPDLRDRPRLIAPADSGRMWAGFKHQYRLELLNPDGRRERAFNRALPWFGPDRPRSATRQPGSIRDLAYDPRSRSIRVLLYREDMSFRPRARRGSAGGEGPVAQLDEADARARYEIYMEVLDSRSGRVVAHGDLNDRLIAGFLSPTEVYAHREDGDGSTVIDVWRIRLAP